ncbi:MAG: peptidoglycan editing factor PgeF [Firmicutes bacterium]|nr:peptidoglycan editing factor PgeF [Bacillota bacterium]
MHLPAQTDAAADRFPMIRIWEEYPVTAGFTVRQGGFSRGPYAALNLALHVGDDAARVIQNRALFFRMLQQDPKQAIFAEQVHGHRAVVVTSREGGAGVWQTADAIARCDALVCGQTGVLLNILVADCVPILLYDPVHNAVAAVHAGWRGTVSGSVDAAVASMRMAFGTLPHQILAVVGPSIGPCCYAVGSSVAQAVQEQASFLGAALGWRGATQYFDLWMANRLRLNRLGIDRVQVLGQCTFCHSDQYFSYRASNGTCGRMAGFIRMDGRETSG